MLRSCFLSSCVEFYSAVSEEKLKMSQQIIGQGDHFVFPIHLKKHKLGRGRWDLASYQVSSNSFHSFRGEVENVSANQRSGQPFCFFPDLPEKHKHGRRHWEVTSCQVSLNSIQRFQRKSRKCLSQSEARAAILFFRSAQKTQTW